MKVTIQAVFKPTVEERRLLISILTKYEFNWEEKDSEIHMVLENVDLTWFRLDEALRQLEQVQNRKFAVIHLGGEQNGKKKDQEESSYP